MLGQRQTNTINWTKKVDFEGEKKLGIVVRVCHLFHKRTVNNITIVHTNILTP